MRDDMEASAVEMLRTAGFQSVSGSKNQPHPGEVIHEMGTARMGRDRASAVVDADLRAFDHPNLFIQGSAVFPTCGAANPTLTIAALALRSVDAIRATLANT